MVDHLDSTSLMPFKKRRNGYQLPGLAKEAEDRITNDVDPELRPEEQGYVRHYLAYADILLKGAAFVPSEPEENSSDEGNIKAMFRRGKNFKRHRAA